MCDSVNNSVSWGQGGLPDAPSKGGGASTLLATIGGVNVQRRGDVVYWTGGLQVDADGSPRAYNPDSALGLDRLDNAGHPGNWWGILTDNGRTFGKPIIQCATDPAPGFYISATSLYDPHRDYRWNDPRRFVNAETIPYVVLPPELRGALPGGPTLDLGDFAVVVNLANGRKAGAVVADIGPHGEIGEGSIALAGLLGVNADPRTGGTNENILVCLFAGSRTAPAWPHTITEINACVAGLVTQHHLNLPNLPAT